MKGMRLVLVGVALLALWGWWTLARNEKQVQPPPPAPAAAPAPPAAPPAPPPSPPAPEPAKPPPPAAARPAKPSEEDEMARIRASVKSAPREAIALIDAADRAHPGSPLGEERLSLRIDALVYAGDVGLARDHAEDYLRRYPDGAFADHVERLTGVHPH